ncbi:MAG: very short patch repair endonuclease [Deltaproteobacteria bacterium]|nr:very short patch repair endonuclease [Deltaproteobacteria bacterium]
MDIVTAKTRSRMMSGIRGRGNKSTELKVASIFRRNGINGWRRHADIFGKPDFSFSRHKLAVFVDGCFWHGCPRCSTMPKQNRNFWQKKIGSNMERDRKVGRQLKINGWRVVRFWECILDNERVILNRLKRATEK